MDGLHIQHVNTSAVGAFLTISGWCVPCQDRAEHDCDRQHPWSPEGRLMPDVGAPPQKSVCTVKGVG